MSVLYAEDRSAWWAPTEADCFLCGDSVDRDAPAVYWIGAADASSLLLHGPCAGQFGTHLIADYREWQLTGAEGSHWTRRAARALRFGLLAQESAR